MKTNNQPPAKWKYTDQTLFRVCYTNLETGVKNWINHSLVKQLQSEAVVKLIENDMRPVLHSPSLRRFMKDKLEEARVDERKKVLLFIKNSRLVYGLDDTMIAGLIEKELTTHKYGVEQPVENKEDKR